MPRQRRGAGHTGGAGAGSHRPATIKDVARRAGVSVATVSRVMNGTAPVLEHTRERILTAARELHFTPNASARSLSTRRTTALGVVLPDLHGEFFSELLRGLDRVAQQQGRHLLVSSSHHDPHGIAAALRAMHGRVDGLIVMAPDVPATALAESLPRNLPTVLLNCAERTDVADGTAPVRIRMLGVDNVGGAMAMVRHLASLGHERIGFIAGAPDNTDARERLIGYERAMHELGLEAPSAYRAGGDFSEESGWRAAQSLLDASPRPTAIVAANDMMALGALRAARERGLAVPADVSVAGFDDIPTARYVTPPLTTVRVDVESLGAHAASLLLALMTATDGDAAPSPRTRREVLPGVLVTRESCGPPPASTPALPPASLVSTPAASGGGTSTRTGTHRPASAGSAPELIQESVS